MDVAKDISSLVKIIKQKDAIMKKILGTLLLAVGLLSCSSCTKKPGPTEPVPPIVVVDAGKEAEASVPEMEVVIGESWNFTFPSRDWHASPMGEGINAYLNEKDKNLTILVREEFAGTLQQYALLAVRGLKDSGGNLVLTKPTVINGVNFIFMETVRGNDPHIWAWLATKNGSGYTFVCSGIESADDFQKKLCESIALTIQLQ